MSSKNRRDNMYSSPVWINSQMANGSAPSSAIATSAESSALRLIEIFTRWAY